MKKILLFTFLVLSLVLVGCTQQILTTTEQPKKVASQPTVTPETTQPIESTVKEKEPTNKTTDSEQPIDIIAEWKTYKNARYAYEIKHPEILKIDTTNAEKDFTIRGPEKELIGGDVNWSESIFLMVYKIDEGTSIENFIKEKHYVGFVDIQSVTIASGQQAKQYNFVSIDHPMGKKGANTFIKRDDKMYVLNLSNWDLKETYELMITTLSFK